MTDAEHQGPLVGVRVVELGGIGPAPFATMMLADLGADVVRIERPSPDGGAGGRDAVLGRGKRSIALDLRQPEDLLVAQRLIDRADVLVDPFRPGVAERLGLDPDGCLERNPRLVFARMTGWGQTGPLAQAAGHDINYISVVGALHAIGDADRPPTVPLNLVGDYGGGGMLLGFGVVCALFEREQSGQGQVIDVAMVDGVASLMAVFCQMLADGTWSSQRADNWLDGSAPWYGAYETADGAYLTVGALEPQFYAELLERLGLDAAQWPQWHEESWPQARKRLAEIFATKTLDEWRGVLEGTDVCFAPVLPLDAASDHPQIAARETFVQHDGALQPGPAPRFGRTPGAIRRPAPTVGQDTADVRAELDRQPVVRPR